MPLSDTNIVINRKIDCEVSLKYCRATDLWRFACLTWDWSAWRSCAPVRKTRGCAFVVTQPLVY